MKILKINGDIITKENWKKNENFKKVKFGKK